MDTAIVAQSIPMPKSAVAPVAQNPILDTYNAVNWNLQAPGEIDIYTTPFFQPFGGLRVYVTGETTVDHNSTITLGTGSTQIGPLEVSPTSISYQMGESSLDKAGSYITGTSVDLPVDPWAIKVENDITVRKGISSVTLTFGVEFLARPDNLTPPTLFAGLPFFGYGLWHNLTMMGSIGGNNTCMIPGLC
ncbi:MAG: hypothetical protein GYA36_16300 [Veillonellaceae bacterium]|nr:hypothetical protein [Veillonellaceae bacterium]